MQVTLDAAQRRPTWRAQRQRARTAVTLSVVMVSIAITVTLMRTPLGPKMAAALLVAPFATAFGWWISRPFLDASTRRSLRRMVKEYYRGLDAVPFVIEARHDGVLVQCQDVELKCLWTSLTSIEEHPERIELWMNADVIVIRTRGFPDDAARRRFIGFVKSHAPQAEHFT